MHGATMKIDFYVFFFSKINCVEVKRCWLNRFESYFFFKFI